MTLKTAERRLRKLQKEIADKNHTFTDAEIISYQSRLDRVERMVARCHGRQWEAHLEKLNEIRKAHI